MDEEMVLIRKNELVEIITDVVNRAVSKIQPKEPELKDRMSLEEVCSYLNYKKPQIYKLTSDGVIPYSKFGRRLVFSRKEIDRWVNNTTVEHKPIKERVSENLKRQARRFA